VIQGGTVPENETGRIREFQPSHILVIDAALGNLPPGTVFIVDPRTIGRDDLSTHHLPLSLLVQYFEVSLDCRVICLGIQPESVEMGRPVSEPVKRAIALVAERIVDILVRRPVPALT
jgi:hydrogenase 3 maturation protease